MYLCNYYIKSLEHHFHQLIHSTLMSFFAYYLIELNAKWKLGPVDFLEKMHEKYK